ncbi:virulence factor SrfC family protein [Yersinia bercovieri]|uniref:virulence factor SrfC family protein n=1 Tax=Yersinia bercovieri TaxID=634 RepID=UPI0011AB2DDF|nr:virulence factor SrfC family protein [Yersinia bercovieri]
MNPSDPMLTHLTNWLQRTREHSPQLHLEADGLLARLTHWCHRQQKISALSHTPITLGLYGSAIEGKHHLLKMIITEGRDELYVQLGENTLNYLTHINPGHGPTSMAVRFTDAQQPVVENYPLLLTLFSESELAQRLIRQHPPGHPSQPRSSSVITATLAKLQARRQPEPNAGMTSEQFSSIMHCYQQNIRQPYQLDDGLQYQMAELAPWLSLTDRAELLSLLWGGNAALTSQWRQQAQTLKQLGNLSHVLAPASLVVDGFLLPREGFLLPISSEQSVQEVDVIVCLRKNAAAPTYQSITEQELARVCAEITFTLSHPSALAGVELVDIPTHQLSDYQERLQPDTLLICDAAMDAQHVSPMAKSLAQWVQHTQPQSQNSLPRLIWAITPFDMRFTQGKPYDKAVQQAITALGIRWGTLQAVDKRNMASLQEWLAVALNTSCRQHRQSALQRTLTEQVAQQFQRLYLSSDISAANHQQQAEDLIRTLQTQAAQHGELIDQLSLPRESIHQCWLQYHQKVFNKPKDLELKIDLFADDDLAPLTPSISNNCDFASQVYALWVGHLRQWAHRQTTLPSWGLDSAQRQTLCDILISTGNRLKLQLTLAKALAQNESDAAIAITRAANVINDFVGWLGYNQTPLADRPISRISKESAIFAPPPQASADNRLTSLGAPTTAVNAIYIYDWLVALLHRANESRPCYEDIDDKQRKALQLLIHSLFGDIKP